MANTTYLRDAAANKGVTSPGRGWRLARLGPSLLLLSPLLAVAGIFCLLGILLWLLEKDERQSNREELIRDALWVEQALSFQMEALTSRVARLAFDLAKPQAGAESFTTQAGQLQQINREIAGLWWLDRALKPFAAVPARASADAILGEAAVKASEVMAQGTGRGNLSQAFRLAGAGHVVAFTVPVVTAGEPQGLVLAVFRLDDLLTHNVPWWIAQKRALFLRNGSGTVIATRSSIEPDRGADSHTLEIGDPFDNVQLTLVSFQTRSSLAQNGLIAAMIALGLLAVAGVLARERQIRRRRAAEAALGEEHAFRRAMEASLQVGVRARDLNGRILYVNQGFCRMVGYSEDELVGRDPPMPYWLPEDLEHTRRLHDAILAGQNSGQGLEFTFRRKDGTRFVALVYETPLVDAQGRPRGWMGSFVDITDRKQAEELARAQAEKMQHTARLVTMGEMASLLAHDLNQPLAAIRSYETGLVNLLAAEEQPRREIVTALDAIGKAAERAGKIVRSVQDFVRRREPRLEPLNVREAVGESLALLDSELRKAHVLVETAFQPLLPLARADRVLIEQVLVNLIRNAIDAMSDQESDKRRLTIAASWPSTDGRIEVRVRDTGRGVDPETAAKLFTPFHSTKPGGMGMGLTICRSILELHGTQIAFVPAEGGGSVFHFSLQVVETRP